MNASKENARKSIKFFEQSGGGKHGVGSADHFIMEFLKASERKLPTEAAYKRDRERRKK